MAASIKQALQNHEPLARELSSRAAELYDRLQRMTVSFCGPASATPRRLGFSGVFRKSPLGDRRATSFAEAPNLLRDYAKTLYQCLVLRQAGDVFLTLRGHLADEMREINSCRVRLCELLSSLEGTTGSVQTRSGTVKYLYPAGCEDLKETLAHFEEQLNADVLKELDVRMETMLEQQFTALVNVCLASGNVLKNVETAMLHTAQEFLAERLGEMNVAAMFREQYADDEQAATAIADFFDKAAPQLCSSVDPATRGDQLAEFCVLAAPSGPAGERFRSLATKAVPGVAWQPASGEEEILLYRELAYLPLAELPQLGPLAQDACQQMSNAEHFTPYCRCDVNFNEPEA